MRREMSRITLGGLFASLALAAPLLSACGEGEVAGSPAVRSNEANGVTAAVSQSAGSHGTHRATAAASRTVGSVWTDRAAGESSPSHAHAEPTRAARRDLARAKAQTARYHRLDVAESAGYGLPPEGPLHECISSLDAPAAMGLHWINGDLVSDAVLDPSRPEALVYGPTADGGRRLVALEYVVFEEAWTAQHPGETPRLFGQDLMYVADPNRYELPAFFQIHAWVWKRNPDGVFTDFNPTVSCEPRALLPETR